MSGKAAKGFKFAVGKVADAAKKAGSYLGKKRTSADSAHGTAVSSDSAGVVGNSAVPTTAHAVEPYSARIPFGIMPRPAMQVPVEELPRVAKDRDAYHALIDKRAYELRVRIAEQAYATVLFGGKADEGNPVQAEAVEVLQDDARVQTYQIDPDIPAEPEPYEKIQDALKTSRFFSEGSDDAYKPTPFSMPRT